MIPNGSKILKCNYDFTSVIQRIVIFLQLAVFRVIRVIRIRLNS
jgi:hypothetical protein